MRAQTVQCRLGVTSVTLITNHQAVINYLHDFYRIIDDAGGTGDWTVEAIVGPADDTMTTNQWGVSHAANPASRRLALRANDPQSLAITARKCVREALVDHCEKRRYAMLHASAVVDDQKVIIVVGDKGSGKTTLAVKAALLHGMRYLSNDHLIVFGDVTADQAVPLASRLTLTALPTLIPLKIGTYLDLEDKLPPPWDTEGLDIDAHRAVPREQLYGLDRRVLYTFPSLGQDSPITVDLGATAQGPAVQIVLARYAGAEEPNDARVSDPVAALMPHVRTDWMFDPALNQRYLPRVERQPAEYDADARRLVTALAQRSRVIEWRHHGDPTPLLDRLSKKARQV